MKDLQDFTIRELIDLGYEVRCIGRDVGGDVSKSSIFLSSRDLEQISEALNSPIKISEQLQKLIKGEQK